MALQDILNDISMIKGGEDGVDNKEINEKRLTAILPELRHLISFFRAYPDYFIDFIKGPDSTFKFYWYQRFMLRAVLRHRLFYGTAPRALILAPHFIVR